MKIYRLFSVFVYVFAALLLVRVNSSLFAQASPVQFFMPDKTVVAGDIVEVEVRVVNFRKIVGASFTVRWDTLDLRFAGFGDAALNISADNNNFGLTQISSGILPFLLIDNSLSGFTLPDSAVLFTVSLEAIADPIKVTDVVFSNDPTIQEVSDTTFEALETLFLDGQVTITSPTADVDLSKDMFDHVSVSPNPFTGDEAVVSWTQAGASEVLFHYYDGSGKLLFSQQEQYSSGDHRKTLKRSMFSSAGVYYLKLQIGDQTESQKIIIH